MTAMLFVILSLISVVRIQSASLSTDHGSLSTARLPEPDGNLNVYVLPSGQGDSHLIQCPDGLLTIVDMGTNSPAIDGHWQRQQAKEFFRGQEGRLRNVMVTHNHWDHANFIPIFEKDQLTGFKNMYISCNYDQMESRIKDWVEEVGAQDKIQMFNGGQACGPKGPKCEELDICPNSAVKTITLSANLANCSSSNTNIDSLMFKLVYGRFSVLFTGDFEDYTSDWGEDGPQKKLVDHWKNELVSTVFKISHHGADKVANKPVLLNAVKPKAIFVSADPHFWFRWPRCRIFDHFVTSVGTLCKPKVTDDKDDHFCGEPVTAGVPPSTRVQTNYTCGISQDQDPVPRFNNEYAIYTNSPDDRTRNLITVKSDGTNWEITPTITARVPQL